jgi:hypothetical protein
MWHWVRVHVHESMNACFQCSVLGGYIVSVSFVCSCGLNWVSIVCRCEKYNCWCVWAAPGSAGTGPSATIVPSCFVCYATAKLHGWFREPNTIISASNEGYKYWQKFNGCGDITHQPSHARFGEHNPNAPSGILLWGTQGKSFTLGSEPTPQRSSRTNLTHLTYVTTVVHSLGIVSLRPPAQCCTKCLHDNEPMSIASWPTNLYTRKKWVNTGYVDIRLFFNHNFVQYPSF